MGHRTYTIFTPPVKTYVSFENYQSCKRNSAILYTVGGINIATLCHMGPKYGPRHQNCFFTKRAQNRDLELTIGASGSKCRCASFLSWPYVEKVCILFRIPSFCCVLPIKIDFEQFWFYHQLVPDASSGRNKTAILHQIARRTWWDRFCTIVMEIIITR